MPTYDLILLLRKMPEMQTKDALKRLARYVFETGGVLRKMENLGFRKCPHKMSTVNGTVKEAHYFLYNFDSSDTEMKNMKEKLCRDRDLVRFRVFFMEDKLSLKKELVPECDIHFDMLDVPFRPHVQQMVEISKKNKKKEFNYGRPFKLDPLH